MSRYDLSRASDLVLFAAVRAATGSPWEHSACIPHSATTRRALEAFVAVLVDEPSESFLELDALRAECRVKTRAEYDREIGDLLRRDPDGLVPCWQPELRSLVLASRFAPEGEP